MPIAKRHQRLLSELLRLNLSSWVTREPLHEMQDKLPIFILIAAGLFDLSGASGSEHHVRESLGWSPPGEAQPRAESSPVPSEVFSITEDNLDEVTFNLQSPAVDSASEMTADSIPIRTETAATSTAVLPRELGRNTEVPEQLHTEAAILKLQDGHTFASKLPSIPVSTQASQATTHLEQPARTQQGKPENITEAGFNPTSSSAGLPQPFLSRGTHRDSPELAAVSSVPVIKQVEVSSPKMPLLTSVVNLHSSRKETAASPLSTGVKIALKGARMDWLPTGMPPTSKRQEDTNAQVQPDSNAGVTPAYVRKTQSTDAEVTTSALLQKPASRDLVALYSRMAQTSAVQVSPTSSLKQETTGSRARSSTTAVQNGSGQATRLSALRTPPQGSVHSALSLHLGAPVHDLLPPPFQEPASTTSRQEPVSLSRTVNCTKQHVSQETKRSSQETTVLILQRDTDHQMMTSKPEKPRSPESPQASVSSSSLSQSWISTLKPSQTTKKLRGVTPALFAGPSALENSSLQPVSTFDSVHAGLQPPGTSFPASVGLQVMGIPTSAEKGLHIPTPSTPTGSGSRVQGISAHPVSQKAFAMMLQMSTREDPKRKKSLPQQIGKIGSPTPTPPSGPVPSPSGPHGNGSPRVPLLSFAPSASHTQPAGSPAALAPLGAQGSRSSPTPAHPGPVVPRVSGEIPAYLAQRLGAHHAATENLSAFRGEQLTMLPTSPNLSFLLRSTNGMICLQPMQGSPLPTNFPNASVGGLVSIQQILAAANSSALDLANLKNLSPSSLILIRPVFILLPSDRPDLQVVTSPEGEDDHKAALLFTKKQELNLGTTESSHDIPMQTSSSSPTGKPLRPETTLSTLSSQQAEKTQVTPQPVLTNPNYTATSTLSPAVASAPKRLLDAGARTSTAAPAAHWHRPPQELQLRAPGLQQDQGTDLLLLHGVSAGPFTSPAPPLATTARHGPHLSPKVFFTTEKPHSSVIPLLSAKGLPGTRMSARPPFTITGIVDEVQHAKKLTPQTASQHQGSVTTSSSVRAQGSVTTSSSVHAQGSVTTSSSVRAQGSVTTSSSVRAQGSVTTSSSVRAQGSVTTSSSVRAQGSVTTSSSVHAQGSVTTSSSVRAQGSVTTSSSVRAQCAECPTLRSARTTEHPVKLFTSITPLQSRSQGLLSTGSLQRQPVPSTSLAFSVLPAGNDHKDQTRTASIELNLTEHLEFTPIVPKPFIVTERPTTKPAHAPFSTTVQMKSTVSGKLLATITHPRMYRGSPASPPASARVPLLSAVKHDQIHRAPAKLFSQASIGESTKPTEISTSARKVGTGKFLGTSTSLSAVFNTRTQQAPTAVLGTKVVLTPLQPSVAAESVIALEQQPKLTQTTSQSPLATTSLSAAKGEHVTTSLRNKPTLLLPTSTLQPDPNVVLPATAGVSKSTVLSTAMGKGEDTAVQGDAAAAGRLPTQTPVSSPHQPSAGRPLVKVSPEDNTEHQPGRSSPDALMHATGPSTTTAFSVSANRLVNKVTNQSAVFSKVAVKDAEMLLARDVILFLPTPESPSHSAQSLAALTPQGDSLLGVANTGQSERLFLNTEAEEMLRTDEVTEEAAEGLVTALTPRDSEPSALLRESHPRRGLQSDAAILNGLAVVSDDVCGSGNYTVQMSLRPAAEPDPEVDGSAPSQETFLAWIAVQSNGSQPVLQIRSCCVTPSASPGAPGATCCLFRRLPFECSHIQVLQSSNSGAASFTIQLFQMLNHSVAYLHCELNVCLHGKAGCEQTCFESAEPLLQPSDRNSHGNPHNLVSFGPVFRTRNRFLYQPREGPGSAMLVPVLLGSLTGFAVLGSAFISLWLHHRQKTKHTHCPQAAEIHGL